MTRLRSRLARLETKVKPVPDLPAGGWQVQCHCREEGESDTDFEARVGSGPDDVIITIAMKFDTELNPPGKGKSR